MARVIGYFESEQGVVEATRSAVEAGFTVTDVFTPYAVHGLSEAMGLSSSRLSWVCAAAGLTGGTFAMGFQIWSSTYSWALNVGGKPFASVPAFVPVTFEATVLSAALVTVAALFARTRLFPGKKATALPRVTDDRFALVLEGDPTASRALLTGAGAVDVEERAAEGGR